MIALLLICQNCTIRLQWQHILNLLVSTHIHSSVHQLLCCYVVQVFAGRVITMRLLIARDYRMTICHDYSASSKISIVHCGRKYYDNLWWRVVWMRSVLGTKLSDNASNTLMSEKTVQQYVERFQQTGSVAPCVKKNSPVRTLSEFDEAILVQATLNKKPWC